MTNESHFCGHCKQPCKVLLIDFGEGLSEFWGMKRFDSNIALASSCHNARVYHDPLLIDEYTLEKQ